MNAQKTMRRKQSGITLLVGLMLLVMLSLIGLIGYRNTTLAERMAGNTQDRNISFQSAENAAKEALTVIEGNAFSSATVGHYSPPLSLGGNSEYWANSDGAAVTALQCRTSTYFGWFNCSAPTAVRYANNASTATYAIELLNTSPVSLTQTASNYRITARSTGGSGNAESIVQVSYTRITSP